MEKRLEKRMKVGDYILERMNNSWYYHTAYRAVRYEGTGPETEIPDEANHVGEGIFNGKNIVSLTIPELVSIYEIGTLPSLRKLVMKSKTLHMDVQSIRKYFPNIERIEMPCIKRLEISYYDHGQCNCPMLFIESPSIERIYGEISQKSLVLFVPNISPGMVSRPLRYHLIRTYLDHPDWYDKNVLKKYHDWIQNNGNKFLLYCLEDGEMDLFNELLFRHDIRFSARTYDCLMEKAEERNDTALKASVLNEKIRYYDLEKIAQRRETLETNDLNNPLRAHAMRKIWSWSKLGDDSLCIKKMKQDGTDILNGGIVHVPSEIGGTPVVKVERTVFSDVKVEEVVFPENITEISEGLFRGHSELRRVTFQEDIRIIPNKLFESCDSLESVVFEKNPQWQIGDVQQQDMGAKTGNRGLLIREAAFSDCRSLKELDLGSAILSEESFCNTGLHRIRLRNTQIIPNRCFSECTSLSAADIQGTAMIDYEGFFGCISLTELHVSDDLIYVDASAFGNCKRLNTVYMHHVSQPSAIKNLFCRLVCYDGIHFIPVND